MTALGRYVEPILRELRSTRRQVAAVSPWMFASIYLTEHFKLPMAAMHENIIGDLEGITDKRGSRIVIAAPRGHAKSTLVTLAYALWCLLYGREKLVVIVSNTADQAAKLLSHLKGEMENNSLLREDFPELESVKTITPWRKNTILLPNGGMGMCYGRGQNIRGARHQQHRPTLIIADDLEDKEEVIEEEQRLKTADWFRATLLKAGTTTTNVVVIGTILHHDSLLANLVNPAKTPGWRQSCYRAVRRFSDRQDLWDRWGSVYWGESEFEGRRGAEAASEFLRRHQSQMLKGTDVLWPEAYSYPALMETKLREGEMAFQAEMQNDPLDPSACLFAGAKLRFWDEEYSDAAKLIKALGPGTFYGACDPSLGANPARGDFTAIVALFKPHDDDRRYIIAADIARRTPAATIDLILQYGRMYRFSTFGVEAVQFQQLMVDDLEKRARVAGLTMTVEAIKSRSAKQARISGLEAAVSQGLIVFSRQHQLLLEQLRSFPVGMHDDGPDALEMAVHVAQNRHSTSWENW